MLQKPGYLQHFLPNFFHGVLVELNLAGPCFVYLCGFCCVVFCLLCCNLMCVMSVIILMRCIVILCVLLWLLYFAMLRCIEWSTMNRFLTWNQETRTCTCRASSLVCGGLLSLTAARGSEFILSKSSWACDWLHTVHLVLDVHVTVLGYRLNFLVLSSLPFLSVLFKVHKPSGIYRDCHFIVHQKVKSKWLIC